MIILECCATEQVKLLMTNSLFASVAVLSEQLLAGNDR